MTEHIAKPIIGLIGTGVMGKSMAGHCIQAGYEVHVYTRTKAKAQELLEKGANWQDTPGAISAEVPGYYDHGWFPE